MHILAIDPGPEKSAWVVLAGGRTVVAQGYEENEACLSSFCALACPVAIERVASHGRPVGQEIFDTCVWIGRFVQWATERNLATLLPFRREICAFLCGYEKGVNDAVIRQRVIDLYGPGKSTAIGTKRAPGPLYGVKRDVWQALAVGLYAWEQITEPHYRWWGSFMGKTTEDKNKGDLCSTSTRTAATP
jgi:hypothetical protein